jgi:hypothetical protein
MSEEKKTRAMTIKRFVNAKYSGKTTAEGFLAAHMEFLRNHTFLSPILEAYENKEILPTPTIQACQQALFTHMVESDAHKAREATKAKAQEASKPKVVRKGDKEVKEVVPKGEYTITLMVKVYDRNGQNMKIEVGTVERKKFREVKKNGIKVLEPYTEVVPAVWATDDYSAANRLADRRLFDRGDSVYAVIVNTQGKPIESIIQRDDAIARVLKQPKGPAARTRGTSTKTLGFGVKAKNDRSTGPWNYNK